MANRTKKDNVQLSLSIDGKPAEDTLQKLDNQNEKLTAQMRELENAGKQATDQYKKLKEEQQKVLKEAEATRKKMQSAAEKQRELAINEGKSLRQLEKEWRALKSQLRNLTEDHKDYNKILELTRKKGQVVTDLRKKFFSYRQEVKATGNEIRQVGVDIGDLVTGGLLTGGILGAVDLLQDAGQAVAEMVEQMRDLRIEINQITGATGEELDGQAVKIQALATTFELEQRELLLSANAISKEFNITIEESLNKIEEGLIAGANVNGEFLDNIKEYSVQFAAAEFSAEEFVAVSTKASKEGIFSDKGLDVVKEFGIRIQEQTTATKKAMESAFGKQFTNELFGNINDGSLTTVDALKLVSREMNNAEIPANQLQTVIADVFGGPGEDAGLRYIQMLQDVQAETINLIEPTNQYVQAQMAQLAANEELAFSQNELTKQLEDTGNSLSVFLSNVKAGAINTLVSVLQFFEQFSATAKGIGAATKQFFTNIWNNMRSNLIDIQILYHQTTKLNPFGDTNAEIDKDIAALKARKAELAAESKSVGAAYREAFLEGLEEVEARKSASAALKQDPTANLPKPGNFRGRSQAGLTEEEKNNEEQAQREITDIQRIGQIEQINQVEFTEEEKKRLRSEGDLHASDLLQQELDRVTAIEEYKRQQAEETAQKKAAMEKVAIDVAEDAFNTTISLLSADERARKKNAKAIRAFQIGQVFTNLFEEISGIWKTANSSPLNILFPGAGTAIAIAKTTFASARAQLAVSNIKKQKFDRGGIAKGASHAQGGIQLFDTASNQIVGEMEGGEPYMILSKDTYKNNRSIVDSLLHNSMHKRGAPIFATGGIFQSQAVQSQTGLNQSTQRMEQLQMATLKEQQQMRQAIEAIPTTLKADVSIHSINDANETLSDVRKAASL